MAIKMPTIGSDEWFYWLLDQLAGRGETGVLDDATINAVVANTSSHTRATIIAMYTSGDADTLTAAKAYVDAAALAATNTAKAYADSKDGVTLTGAKVYTDAAVANLLDAAKAYADSKDMATRADAFAHADQVTANIKGEAKAYTDSQVAAERTARTSGDASTLTAAKAYADSIGGAGGSFETFKQYADDADGNVAYNARVYADTQRDVAVNTAGTSAAAGDAATLATAKTYADGKTGVSQAQLDAGDASTLSAAKVYADAQRAGVLGEAQLYADNGDGGTLTAAKAYTDSAVEDAATGIATSVDAKVQDGVDTATGYADGLNTTTLGLVQDGDNGVRTAFAAADAATLASAKTYTDGKTTVPGWTSLVTVLLGTVTSADFAYRVMNGRVELRGQIKLNGSASYPNGYTSIGTLPTAARPASQQRIPVGMFNGVSGLLVIATDGTMQVGASTTPTAGDTIYVSHVSYPNS